jgi:hypothetical protein
MTRKYVVLSLVLMMAAAAASGQQAGRSAGSGLVVGLEYAVVNNPQLVAAMARDFAQTGMPGMKLLAEATEWGAMQRGPNLPIDFSKPDLFVREYQKSGFTELTIALKPHSVWGSVDVKQLKYTNASPKPQYRADFQRWVASVVERYDGDGVADMPGLRWPVRYVEIGSEFSSYEPEPVADYLETLRLAYEAAHRASDRVLVAHAAFLITPVNMNVRNSADYDNVWAKTKRADTHHDLADMRAVLDHPELFDVINFHNLGEPYEIEHVLRWLAYETSRRGYTKPVIISDTVPTSYIGWGPATVCTGSPLGLIGAPATEADRCRLAAYFTKLVNGNAATLAWTRGFVAADHVQRTIIAAEQGVRLINLSFTADIPLATSRFFRAAAGISAWGGAVRPNPFTGQVLERYPLFNAIRQMMGHLASYQSIQRVPYPDPMARVYRVTGPSGVFWIAWRDPRAALLPEDGEPGLDVQLDVGAPTATLEPVITQMGQTQPTRSTARTVGGRLTLRVTHRPVYIRTP